MLAPEGANFQILSTNPYELNPSAPAKQNTNPGTRMLGILTPSPAAGELEITVLLELVEDEFAEPAPPPLPRPVRDWRRDAPEDAMNRSLFRAWKEERLVGAPDGDGDDPDGDHADIFAEYAFLADPLHVDPSALPRIENVTGHLLLRVRRWAGGHVEGDGSYRARGIRYAVEHNEGLLGDHWSIWPDAWNHLAAMDAIPEGGETVWIPLSDEADSKQTQAYRVSVFNHSPSVE